MLGHNGAGKTTTVRMLTGRTKPTGGDAQVAGFDIVTGEQIKPIINLVFEDQNLYERLTGLKNGATAGLHQSVRSTTKPGRSSSSIWSIVDAAARKRKVKTYSTGMKQRLLIARALINNPSVLFLDEPTRGLDPASAHDLREIIRNLAREGATILLTTHCMEEADDLCQRVGFMSEGKLVALDEPRH